MCDNFNETRTDFLSSRRSTEFERQKPTIIYAHLQDLGTPGIDDHKSAKWSWIKIFRKAR